MSRAAIPLFPCPKRTHGLTTFILQLPADHVPYVPNLQARVCHQLCIAVKSHYERPNWHVSHLVWIITEFS